MDSTTVQELISSSTYRRVRAFIEEHRSAYLEEICRICEIPAPPFQESRRAEFVARRFREAGFSPEIDGEGNVVVIYPAGDPRRGTLVVSAHLDTVFPDGTVIRIRREGNRLFAPGISDNSASVAALIFLAQALREVNFTPSHELVFLANVGEEGLGDLRGMKYFFQRGLGAQRDVRASLVLDGPLGMVSNRGIGSRRLAVTYRGPGGHSWGDFGRPSPVQALADAISAIYRIQVPKQPRTTYNVGVISGGTSINTIAESAQMMIDLRSEDQTALQDLEKRVRDVCRQVLLDRIDLDIQVVGERPTGHLPADHPLVQLVIQTGLALGLQVHCVASSTDANLPLSMAIPALSIGVKRGGGAHTLHEYLRVDSIVPGFCFGAAVLLGFSRWIEGTSPETQRILVR